MGNLGVPFLFCLFNRTNKQKSRVQTRHGCPRHPTPQRCETVAGFCGRPRNTENNAMSSLKRGEPFPTEAFAVMIYSRRRRLVVPLSLFFFFLFLRRSFRPGWQKARCKDAQIFCAYGCLFGSLVFFTVFVCVPAFVYFSGAPACSRNATQTVTCPHWASRHVPR